ncbi:uridine diphosphate glucose pyrophosphatase NUDT22 [Genypterus blacodes]|uniref:uridine diphosphate glucose pyrophosphatase NUDT22 n=1 Tax=Genypterus blacodes TaxID=154954 RepID=UPI003F757E0B
MMDPEVSVLLHCAPWGGLLQSQVQVELSERYDRQTDASLQSHIEKVWTERVSKNPWLFNGAKFRLHSFSLVYPECHPSSSVSTKHPPCNVSPNIACAGLMEGELHGGDRGQEGSPDTDPAIVPVLHAVENSLCHNGITQETAKTFVQTSSTCDCRPSEGITSDPSCTDVNTDDGDTRPVLTLRLGLTCYKDFLGTNWSGQAVDLRKRGEAEFNDPLALLAQPLGVGGVLCTDDGQVVLIRRSKRVAEAPESLDIPGGHPEPKLVCEGLAVSEEQISIALLQQRPEAVVSELFSSVCSEIRDEVNVPLSFLGEPVLMGVALNHTSAGRPSAEFYISCSLSSDEVKTLYWMGGAEAQESTDIIFLSRAEILQLDTHSPLWTELCPSAKGAVLLFQMVMADRGQDDTTPADTHNITSAN